LFVNYNVIACKFGSQSVTDPEGMCPRQTLEICPQSVIRFFRFDHASKATAGIVQIWCHGNCSMQCRHVHSTRHAAWCTDHNKKLSKSLGCRTLPSAPSDGWLACDVDQPRLRRVVDLLIRESGVRSEWFQVFGTGFFDESDLSQVGLGQSWSFPAWRQRTGSAVLDVYEGGNRPADLRQSPPVEKTPPSHWEPPPTTTSGLLPTRWKAPRTNRNHPPEHVDEICLWCGTPSMSCGTANMPHGHNGRDGEAENC